jgi:cyclophilin family peptidyl-prolyl cis-trans isomerase
MTAWNFAQLAKKKYFDNTSFMRVVPNFVIQGGDPRNDMNGGPGYAIRDEINLQKYTRGAVGMALSGPDTGGSQFFITHSPQPHLDGGYTIFGRVYDGMSGVVDQTERGDRVVTIAIDEHPPVADISIANVSLPLEIGPMTADRLLTRVPDYAQRKSDYKPDITVLEMMKSYVQGTDHVEVFMGTWCSDSQREVPKFLRILDDLRANFGVELPVKFVAVDRAKQQPADLIAGKHLDKVATFIYYRGDEELGRIVERTQSPLFEDDLLTIVAK